jgi:hypothetical protein
MMLYLTGEPGAKGGLKMGEMRLWPNIQAAMEHLRDPNTGRISRWGGRLFRVTADGSLPVKIDVARLGFGDYSLSDKAVANRRVARVKRDAADDTFELHERYGKHEFVRAIGDNNFLMHCPACGAFGILLSYYGGKDDKTVTMLPSDFSSPVIFNLPDLMNYMKPDMRQKLASYLKSVGYGRVSPEKLVALDAMLEG